MVSGNSSHASSPVAGGCAPLLEERRRAPGIPVGYVSGHGERGAILFQRATCRDARAPGFSGFDHQQADRHAPDDPVANRQILRRRVSPLAAIAPG